MYQAVKQVQPLPDYKLKLAFSNNEIKTFDMKPYLDKGIFKQLKNEAEFYSVKVSFDSISWSNGADIDPEILYEEGY